MKKPIQRLCQYTAAFIVGKFSTIATFAILVVLFGQLDLYSLERLIYPLALAGGIMGAVGGWRAVGEAFDD